MAAKKKKRSSRTNRGDTHGVSRELERVRFGHFEEMVVRHLRDQGDVVTLDDGWKLARAHARHLMAWFRKAAWPTMTDSERRRYAASAARSMYRWL